MTPCIVADLGGTFLRCAIVGRNDEVRALERIRLPGDAFWRSDAVWTTIVEAIAAYVGRHAESIAADSPIAFAFPGPVTGSIVVAAPTVRGGDGVVPDVRFLLAARTGRDVVVLNDVSAAAWYFSERVAAERFVVVTVSSGIGAKVFDRLHPRRVLDDSPFAGEIGHLIVDEGPLAPRCDCGGYGHLGGIASARGFERGARLAAQRDPKGFARSLCVTRLGATVENLTNEAHLVPAACGGDAWTGALLRAATRPLAKVLRCICVSAGLDGIVLMGGFAQALGECYRSFVEAAVGTLSDRGPARGVLGGGIRLASAGEEPSLVGAAIYARAVGVRS